jgi:Spy/CpxP family protein refolding chaperone
MTLMTDGAQTESTSSQGADDAAASAAASGASDQQSKADGQKTESDQPGKGAPESYEDFKFADDQKLPDGLGDEIKSLAKDLNLTQDQAQKLADRELARVSASAKAQAEQVEKLSNEWVSNAKTDKEFGGEKFDANIAVAKRGLEAFASPELKELLGVSGLGNHPEVIRLFLKVGTQISDDGTFVGASKSANDAPGYTPFEKAANAMYPNSQR